MKTYLLSIVCFALAFLFVVLDMLASSSLCMTLATVFYCVASYRQERQEKQKRYIKQGY